MSAWYDGENNTPAAGETIVETPALGAGGYVTNSNIPVGEGHKLRVRNVNALAIGMVSASIFLY